MNQQQQIEFLDKLMPEIVQTGDPAGVMMKRARATGMAPAQLERLGHVFNTMRTLVGLEKQASRGGSFSIVDVPQMVKDYISYKPKGGAPVEKKAATKGDSWWDWCNKPEAGSYNLLTNEDIVRHLGNPTKAKIVLTEGGVVKSASASKAEAPVDEYAQSKARRKAYEFLEGCKSASYEEARQNADAIRRLISPDTDGSKWAEAAADAVIVMGKEASAVVKYVEKKFADFGIRIPSAPDFTKEASLKNTLARDRYGVLAHMQNIADCAAMYKWADDRQREVKEKDDSERKKKDKGSRFDYEKAVSRPASEVLDAFNPASQVKDVVGFGRSMRDFVSDVLPDDKVEKRMIGEAKDEAAWRSAMDDVRLGNEVIANADPQQVERIMQTLRVLAPSLSKHPETLAPIVATALDAGGIIPVPMMKSVTDIEKNIADTTLRNNDIASKF